MRDTAEQTSRVTKVPDVRHMVDMLGRYRSAVDAARRLGRSELHAQGRVKGKSDMVARLLKEKFGEIDGESQTRLAEANEERLGSWATRLLSAQTLNNVLADAPCEELEVLACEPHAEEPQLDPLDNLEAFVNDAELWEAFGKTGWKDFKSLEEELPRAREVGRDYGRKKGWLEAKGELLLRLLRQRFGSVRRQEQRQIAEATDTELNRWTQRLLYAAEMDDVIEPPPRLLTDDEVATAFYHMDMTSARKTGYAEGYEEGLLTGCPAGKAKLLIERIGKRFWTLNNELTQRIHSANEVELDIWLDRLSAADVLGAPTIDDVFSD
jgi:hypothetical protein